jgi:hypothetical protein
VLKVADEAVKVLIITRLQTVSSANNNKTESRCKNATLSANPLAPKLIFCQFLNKKNKWKQCKLVTKIKAFLPVI